MKPTEHIVVKDSEFERWSEILKNNRHKFIDADMIQMFEICQNLTSSEAADLYDVLKADIEQSSTVAKDASTM